MEDTRITKVRHDPLEADGLLRRYAMEGEYGLPRLPRGIAPPQITVFVKARVNVSTGPVVMTRVLEILQFYERTDAVSFLTELFFKRRPIDRKSLQASLVVAQIAGEIGEEDDAKAAAEFIDTYIFDHPLLADDLPRLCAAWMSIVGVGDPAKSERRINAEVLAAEPERDKTVEGLRIYTERSSARDNDWKRALRVRAEKARLLAAAPEARRPELVNIYMGESPLSGLVMEVWAARLLRRDALTSPADAPFVSPLEPLPESLPAIAEFEKHVKRLLPQDAKEPSDEFAFVRAAQAIVYFGGTLSAPVKTAYDKLDGRTPNFLWDDPFEPPRPGEGLTNEDDE